MINKEKHIEIEKGTQNHNCMPQPVILANGQMLISQINMTYNIIDKNKAKKALKNGINIFRKLEYEGITNLRKFVDNVNSIENITGELENALKNKLSEIGQDLGVQVIELHIKFGDKNDFNIGNNSYNTAMEDIRDNNYEETNAKYNFSVSMKTGWRKWHSKKTIFNTKINIQNDKLNYTLGRDYENLDKRLKHLERKYNSFTEGTQHIYVDDILSIKYKIRFTFALCFNDFMAFLCAIVGILFPVIGQLSFWGRISRGIEKRI